MCGICGIYGLEQLDQPREIIRRMNSSMQHRGPDASGEYVDDHVALGHQRLSIIDLTDSANQPMHSADGQTVVIFNGELYNFRELKSELSDYPFQTDGDTEVVVAAYQKWGIDAIQRFNGMFAIAIYDRPKNEIFLVRDRLGVKPLYYAQVGQSLVFASEVRAMLASELISRQVNKEAVVDYLRYQCVHAPETLVSGVHMVMPGTCIQLSDTEQKVFTYWSLVGNASNHHSSLADTKQHLSELFENAVRERLVADVPFGAFLSGGIDSSLVVGLMARNMTNPVKTFSVTFDEDEFSEAPYARMIADKFATDHTEIKLNPTDFLKDLPNALAAMDHPSGDGPNTYVVSRVTKEAGLTMALSGTGGDELFCGYDIFKRVDSLQSKRWLLSFPKWVRAMAGQVLQRYRPGISSAKTAAVLKADYFDIEHVYWVSRLLFFDRGISKLVNVDAMPANRVFQIASEQVAFGEAGYNLPLLSRVSVAEISTYLQNVLLRDTDQMSMAHALEVRVPFMDHQLVEYVLGIPDEFKYPHSPKKLLVDSFSDILPDEIVNRPKMGFTFPWERWLRKELRTFVGDHLSDLSRRSLFNAQGIEELWSNFDHQHSNVNWAHVWNLVVLEQWIQQNDLNV